METIQELKQLALEREQARIAAQRKDEENQQLARQRHERALMDFINNESPLGMNARIILPEYVGDDVTVSFRLEEHTKISARYVWNHYPHSDQWQHIGFDSLKHYCGYADHVPDAQKMWRVDAYTDVSFEHEDSCYRPKYTPFYCAELGDALLIAERTNAPTEISEENAAEMNSRRKDEPAAQPIPDPTTEEKFMTALKDLILEFASQQYARKLEKEQGMSADKKARAKK